MSSVQWCHPRWPWNTFQDQTRRRYVPYEKKYMPPLKFMFVAAATNNGTPYFLLLKITLLWNNTPVRFWPWRMFALSYCILLRYCCVVNTNENIALRKEAGPPHVQLWRRHHHHHNRVGLPSTYTIVRETLHSSTSCAARSPPQYATAPPWLLTLKSVWESHVTWGTPVQSFVFLGFLVFELEPMYATSDRRTDDGRRSPLNAPPPTGRGHNNKSMQKTEKFWAVV